MNMSTYCRSPFVGEKLDCKPEIMNEEESSYYRANRFNGKKINY